MCEKRKVCVQMRRAQSVSEIMLESAVCVVYAAVKEPMRAVRETVRAALEGTQSKKPFICSVSTRSITVILRITRSLKHAQNTVFLLPYPVCFSVCARIFCESRDE